MEPSASIRPGDYIEGDFFPEPVRVLLIQPIGENYKISAIGLRTGQYYERALSLNQISILKVIYAEASFEGNPKRFRLGIEAARLSLAYGSLRPRKKEEYL